MHRIKPSPSEIERLRTSVQECGFGALPAAIVPAALEVLKKEAAERCGASSLASRTSGLRYRGRMAPLGPEAEHLLSHDATALLAGVFGGRWALSKEFSCLTYYGPGDHLGLHRDEPADACEVTFLAYISASGPAPTSTDTGLVLRVFREGPRAERRIGLTIPTTAGAVVVGRGCEIWHERPMLQPKENVTAVTGCFRRLRAVGQPAAGEPATL